MSQAFSYQAPIDDMRFILNDVLRAPQIVASMPDFKEHDWITAQNIVAEGIKLAENVFHPLNMTGDHQGCQYDPETKAVRTPDGFVEAFDQYRAMGLSMLSGRPEYGGFCFPKAYDAPIKEAFCAANFSLVAYAGLTLGAYSALEEFASDEVKQTFLPKLLSSEWTGTMCLTEPNAGTDLGLIRTKALPLEDGSYSITGNKIYITGGEHDLAENICHLVLAKAKGSPDNVKGISLFVVPKKLPDAKGEAGEHNNVTCTGIERKMGINGSATCSMSFDESKGWLVGEMNKGMKAMFIMMNDARIKVGMQGLGIADLAYQRMAQYASDRVQGKKLKDVMNMESQSVTIIHHPNIRKDLLDAKVQIEAFRSLIYRTSLELDIAKHHPSAARRTKAQSYAELMTPVIKAGATKMAVEVALRSVETHGGSGFITETGAHQDMRDSVIAKIYEGTNAIQALDMMFRKVFDISDHMDRLGQFMVDAQEKSQSVMDGNHHPKLRQVASMLKDAKGQFADMTERFMFVGMSGDLDGMGAYIEPYMNGFTTLVLAYEWLEMMLAAERALDQEGISPAEEQFYQVKLHHGAYYASQIMMPNIAHVTTMTQAGADGITSFNDLESFTQRGDIGIGRSESAPLSRDKVLKLTLG